MKIKFVRIDPIVNKIEISVDGGKTWMGGPVDEAAKSQLLANGFPLDDVKNKPGFNINNILIKANDGEASKSCLDIVIEPNLQEYTLKYIPYKYAFSEHEPSPLCTQQVYYAGNLSLLNSQEDLIPYLLFQDTRVSKASAEANLGVGIGYMNYFINDTELPNNGLDFLYVETYDGTPITDTSSIAPDDFYPSNTLNKRSVLVSTSLVKIGDTTTIMFNDYTDTYYPGNNKIASPKGLPRYIDNFKDSATLLSTHLWQAPK